MEKLTKTRYFLNEFFFFYKTRDYALSIIITYLSGFPLGIYLSFFVS